ncbi:hypothetical protein [Calidifontibacillus oryziterrae]|uniref:hypothetical protein n=1 Tax=Calidifontibacillus oryziterrae TaxID=1191699 RepID=UPI0003089100|nr:hypothetical protein [Calidifontibacillus oryziterrae]
MKIIHSQPYKTVNRRIEGDQQLFTQMNDQLDLYNDRISTKDKHFLLKDIFDISFKSFSSNEGLLYLHTNQGVYSFSVKENPSSFITSFKSLKS